MIKSKIIHKNIKPDKDCRFIPLLENISDDRLIGLYFQTLDWCMERQFPTDKVLQKIGKVKGVYFDENVRINNENKIAIFNCVGEVNVDGFTVSELFVRDSEITINANDNSIVILFSVNSKIKTNVGVNAKIMKI